MRFGALSWRGLKLAISADNHAFRTEWNPKKKKWSTLHTGGATVYIKKART
jgi:hypothetical protein